MPATVTPRTPLDVALDHLRRVDPVDVIGAEHTDVIGPLVVDQVQALVDRVRGAGKPLRSKPLLCGHRRDVVPEQRRQSPDARDVPVEAVALVLREDDDAEIPGVDEIREREVDQPVVPAERNRGLRAVGRERQQALALAACEHKTEHRSAPCALHSRAEVDGSEAARQPTGNAVTSSASALRAQIPVEHVAEAHVS